MITGYGFRWYFKTGLTIFFFSCRYREVLGALKRWSLCTGWNFNADKETTTLSGETASWRSVCPGNGLVNLNNGRKRALCVSLREDWGDGDGRECASHGEVSLITITENVYRRSVVKRVLSGRLIVDLVKRKGIILGKFVRKAMLADVFTDCCCPWWCSLM